MKTFDELVAIEWEAGRVFRAVRGFADQKIQVKLSEAEYIIQLVRSAGQYLCDASTSEADRKFVIENLIQDLYKKG